MRSLSSRFSLSCRGRPLSRERGGGFENSKFIFSFNTKSSKFDHARRFAIGRQFVSNSSSTLRRGNLKMQQSPAILDLCLRKTRSGKSRDYRDVIFYEKLRFQNVFHPHKNENMAFSNSFCFKSVFEKLCFLDRSGHPTRNFHEISVRESLPFLRLSKMHCQKATDFLLKHHLKDSQPEKCREKQSLRFSEGIFLQFLALKTVA